MSVIIPASLHTIGGGLRAISKDGSETRFEVVGFVVSDSGDIEKAITFPTIAKSARIERNDGISGWVAFSLEV